MDVSIWKRDVAGNYLKASAWMGRYPLSQQQYQSHERFASTAPFPGEPSSFLAEIVILRSVVVRAWQERGVTLTSEEQSELKQEITQTAVLLHDLIGHG